MQCPVTLDTTKREGFLSVLTEALAYIRRPQGWMDAEYAAHKAHAVSLLQQMGATVPLPTFTRWTLDLFDWHVLQGELARLHIYRDHAQAMWAFVLISRAIEAEPGARDLEQRAAALAAAERRLEDARLEAATRIAVAEEEVELRRRSVGHWPGAGEEWLEDQWERYKGGGNHGRSEEDVAGT